MVKLFLVEGLEGDARVGPVLQEGVVERRRAAEAVGSALNFSYAFSDLARLFKGFLHMCRCVGWNREWGETYSGRKDGCTLRPPYFAACSIRGGTKRPKDTAMTRLM